ncbi:PAS domain S-box protein [Schnuerera sp. xch1]|uniref:sensor histidine kinase n=1 Tax=Schnuerera sp. xch1 TaxID=2874283 RepID=UPI001CBE2A05|nr:HAMP domain-containing sensor histidine kinase [Schnuerera sp. xch1]MBZ2175913.1 PAS domain S-box protein [Schnuerera sp. xch1]
MRIDIENKILIPFMILLIVTIIVIGTASYWNGYKLLLNNEIQNLLADLDEMILYIKKINDETEDEEEAKALVLNFYNNLGKDNLIIFNSNEILLNTFDRDKKYAVTLTNKNLNDTTHSISIGDYIFIYQKYNNWNWILGYRINRNIFSDKVLESQKYLILIAIVSLIFSMETAILISYNISKPIKTLAEFCNKITNKNSLQKIYEIKRKDEVGVLANSFNNMIEKLEINTEKLIEVKKFNENIVKNVPAGIMIVDQRGHIKLVNKIAKELLSKYTENKIDRYIMKNVLNQVKETMKTKKMTNKLLTFNDINKGNKIYLEVVTSILTINKNSNNEAICIFTDVSERKKIENNMAILDRLTSTGQLAAGIAHEVRNPLAGIRASIQVLERRLCKEEDSTNKKLFDGLLNEIDRINNLITELLNFAKPRMPNYKEIDLAKILAQSLQLLAENIKIKNVKVDIKNNSSQNIILADKAQIEQIFINIINNALAAMDNNGLLNITINNYLKEKKPFVEIEFHDNGCGISPQNIKKVFNPFFTTSLSGTGLGLSVVYELIKSNNGEIDIQSMVNKGTKVKIMFPIFGGWYHEDKVINRR